VSTEVTMPKWGLTMKEGKISRWFKAEGDAVKAGEPLFEVETSKITNDVESPGDGLLFQIVVPAGETVPVQTVVAMLAQPGETPERLEQVAATAGASAPEAASKPDKPTKKSGGFVPASPIARRLAKQWNLDLSQIPGSGPNGRVTEQDVRSFKEEQEKPAPASAAQPVNASDSAKSLAAQAGLDISGLSGSGPAGRITKIDVMRAINAGPDAQPRAGIQPGVYPLAGMRQIIADNMMTSLHGSAQLTVFVTCDVTDLHAWLGRLRASADAEGPRFSYNDFIALAVCRTLPKHPMLNSWLTEDGITVHGQVNLGIAVALDDGLMVPNVKNAQQLSLSELGLEIRKLAGLARKGGLTMDEIQGGTFTISNVSMLGVDGFTPILNPPETGILGVGRAMQAPAVHNGQIAVRRLMTLSLTFDHRVVDGAPAMRFLRSLADLLEDPAMALV